MQGGNQPEIVEHRRAQFAGELMHDVHRLFHGSAVGVRAMLRSRPLVLMAASFFKAGEPDIDTGQGLGDDVVQFAADLLAFSPPALREVWRDNQPQLYPAGLL